MKVKEMWSKLTAFTDKRSPELLTGLGIAGLIVTGVMAYKAGTKASVIMESYHEDKKLTDPDDKETLKQIKKEAAKKILPVVAPPVIMGITTGACILGAHKVSSKRLAVLSAAYSIADSKLKDYQEKMLEVVGEKKAEQIRDAVAKKSIEKNPLTGSTQVIMTGDGDVMCIDSHSGRYFRSNAEKIGQAINALSAEAISEMYISLNDFYEKIGLPRIPMGDDFGWNIDDLMQVGGGAKLPIYYTAVLTPENKPCIAVEYDVSPRMDYRNLR